MGKLIEELNYPKQLIDKAEALLKSIFGESVQEISHMFADSVKYYRLKNQVRILNKTSDLVEKHSLSLHEVNLKALVPFIEKSSLEQDESLQDKWAHLLANIASSPESGLEPRLIKTLSEISSVEAAILDYMFNLSILRRKQRFDRNKAKEWFKYEDEREISLTTISISKVDINKKFKLEDNYLEIFIENLLSLGLVQLDEPEIDIEDNFSEAKGVIKLDMDNKQYVDVDLDLDISTNYYSSNSIKLTNFGVYFIQQCSQIST